ncbi:MULTISPECIES: hypothetical protein [Bacillus cereus group]|uniref:hypothetical protein n=1 Tax=Bacillus cereus group TaxID=86661 RepID=UPI0022E4048E|nr:hypothetical protein [Bacillus cereus group sp. TH152-1LC]MDA1674907.1 hypothetical protein [Bacillus cereus group sp. TH152-1LC]
MKENVYNAIKLKLEQEKMEVEEELTVLQAKKYELNNRKSVEENKLSASTKILKEKKTVRAGMLTQRFNSDFVKQCEKEIKIIDSYIQKQNIELEKIKEQEKYVDGMFQQKLKEKEKQERRKEEEMLFEYKKWLDFS